MPTGSEEGFLFPFYPALTPQRGERASGTYWAILWSRLTALAFSRKLAFPFLPTSTVGPERIIMIFLDKSEQIAI